MFKKHYTLYQIDAFTDKTFKGNPAAVCVMENWPADELMQNIAAENNLSETAFVVKNQDRFEIRWFTPTLEVALCGHATLASAHVLFLYYHVPGSQLHFHSQHSGDLYVSKKDDRLTLDFPVDPIEPVEPPAELLEAFKKKPLEVYQGKTDYLLIYESQKDIEGCDPDITLLKKSKARGIIVSAPGKKAHFVSRFFAPGSGVDEDPVTGSAHTTLTPYWSEKLGKKKMKARQLSKRGGKLICELKGDRVLISGRAVTYLKGEIEV
jgi:PhzF family phenazine biosynthesis protein